MHKPKILFFDIDGTLIDMQKKCITPLMLSTLHKLQANGIRLAIATGRSPMTVPLEEFPGVQFDVFITFNGSYCYDKDRVLFASPIPTEDIRTLRRNGRLMQDVHGAKIAAWWDRAMDIIPTAGGKGTGIAHVLAAYGIDKADAMAFGDGNNDLEMFGAVGTGVAMANGSDALKAAATDICGACAEDGIHHYCVEHGLIEA